MASISDSDCVRAAQDVEQLDRHLDDLLRELAYSSNSNGSTIAEPVKARRNIDFGSLVAWLDGVVETPLPDLTDSSTQPKTPDNFANLLTKPVEQSWLDERAMTATDFVQLAAIQPLFQFHPQHLRSQFPRLHLSPAWRSQLKEKVKYWHLLRSQLSCLRVLSLRLSVRQQSTLPVPQRQAGSRAQLKLLVTITPVGL